MFRTSILLALCLSALLTFGQLPVEPYLEMLAEGLTQPTEIINNGDDRLFVCEKMGRIVILNADGSQVPEPFIDISFKTLDFAEQGLLGMAFHPDFENNGWFYVSYTNLNFEQNIVRYTVSQDNPNIADIASEELIMSISLPSSYHIGGCLRFGPDGYLYVATGDGALNNVEAQNLNSLYGSILRLDVDNGLPYSIPDDNPFSGIDERSEIWVFGLRNPWKFHFDDRGGLWIADVGQNEWEEINYVPQGQQSGLNFGWPCMEGDAVYDPIECGGLYVNSLTVPVSTYAHWDWGNSLIGGCSGSVTGGYVYNGSQEELAELDAYIFGDYCSGRIYATYMEGTVRKTDIIYENTAIIRSISSFGETSEGELLIADISKGTIFKMDFSCRLPRLELSVASCTGSSDGCVEITIPQNSDIEEFIISDSSGQEVPPSDYCRLSEGKYLLSVTNSDLDCSKEIPFEVDVVKPAYNALQSTCSFLNDGKFEIIFNQKIPEGLNYRLETVDGQQIDTSDYNNLYIGDYYLLISDSTMSCTDTSLIRLFHEYDRFDAEYDGQRLTAENIYESYLWFYNESPDHWFEYDTIHSATENIHIPEKIGHYWCRGTDSEGCDHWANAFVDELSAIPQVNNRRNLHLYPNPVSEQLTLEVPDFLSSKDSRVVIYDTEGERVMEKSFESTSNKIISTENWTPGTYLIRLTDGINNTWGRFIKL